MTKYLNESDFLIEALTFPEHVRDVIDLPARQHRLIAKVLGVPRAMLDATPVDTGYTRPFFSEKKLGELGATHVNYEGYSPIPRYTYAPECSHRLHGSPCRPD